MPYEIIITQEAEDHLDSFTARERRMIESTILKRLVNQPMSESKAIKKLRPNPFAQYELRVGKFRVLYNVHQERSEVVLVAAGQKVRNKLFIAGVEFHGHESNSH